MTTVLETKTLSKKFGVANALRNVSMSVSDGEIVCLLGPNGAGKTTLINVFLGFLQPDSGVATVFGVNPTKHPREVRQKISYIPESIALYSELSALQNLQLFNSFLDESQTKSDLVHSLNKVGLHPELHIKKMKSFSKGMRQKVALAIALSKKADVILMDEPLTGLDPAFANEFLERLSSIRDEGATILLASHDIFHVTSIANRCLILRSGEVIDHVNISDTSALDLEQLYLSHMRTPS